MTFISNLFTGKDNKTGDVGRVSIFIGVIGILGLSAVDVYLNKHLDIQGTGLSLAGILGGGQWGIKQKSNTEPE